MGPINFNTFKKYKSYRNHIFWDYSIIKEIWNLNLYSGIDNINQQSSTLSCVRKHKQLPPFCVTNLNVSKMIKMYWNNAMIM